MEALYSEGQRRDRRRGEQEGNCLFRRQRMRAWYVPTICPAQSRRSLCQIGRRACSFNPPPLPPSNQPPAILPRVLAEFGWSSSVTAGRDSRCQADELPRPAAGTSLIFSTSMLSLTRGGSSRVHMPRYVLSHSGSRSESKNYACVTA